MNRPLTATAVAAACLVLAGCSSSTAKPAAAPTVFVTQTVAAAPSTIQSAPATAAADPGILALGKTAPVQYADGSGIGATVTVYGYKQPVATSAPHPDQAGYVWSAADVKVCVKQDVTISNEPWTLVYADSTDAEPSSIGYRQFPEPSYPFGDKEVKAGRCVRGWITFAVPKAKKPTMVEYSLTDGSVVDWKA